MRMEQQGASWRERPHEIWIAVLALGVALSPTNTKIAGAAWLLVCLAGLFLFFRKIKIRFVLAVTFIRSVMFIIAFVLIGNTLAI